MGVSNMKKMLLCGLLPLLILSGCGDISKLKEVKKQQAKARKPKKRKPVKTSKEAEAFLKDFAKKK